ncbi:MAG: lipid-A-disaccharide synthase [Pseudomonadota bacterium]
MAQPHIYMVAAEPSGDLLARETVVAIKNRAPETRFSAIGGDELASLGLVSAIDITPLSIVGLFEGVRIYGTVLKLVEAAVEDIITADPDMVVLVDSWGFMIRIAERLKQRAPHIKRFKLIGPQIWATRPGRAKKLAAAVDELVCIHAMEVPYYTPFDLPVTVMGPPALSRTEQGDRAGFRQRLGISDDQHLLLVLPGSRPSEIQRTAPALVEAARLVHAAQPSTQVMFAPAPSVRDAFEVRFPGVSDWGLFAPEHVARHDVMAAADLALACSGTVTSELAVQGTPFLVGYKTGWMTWAVAKYFLYKPKHITLVNIAADDTEIAPEYVQTDLKADRIADRARSLLCDPNARRRQVEAQNAALEQMGAAEAPAPEIAADAILASISADK